MNTVSRTGLHYSISSNHVYCGHEFRRPAQSPKNLRFVTANQIEGRLKALTGARPPEHHPLASSKADEQFDKQYPTETPLKAPMHYIVFMLPLAAISMEAVAQSSPPSSAPPEEHRAWHEANCPASAPRSMAQKAQCEIVLKRSGPSPTGQLAAPMAAATPQAMPASGGSDSGFAYCQMITHHYPSGAGGTPDYYATWSGIYAGSIPSPNEVLYSSEVVGGGNTKVGYEHSTAFGRYVISRLGNNYPGYAIADCHFSRSRAALEKVRQIQMNLEKQRITKVLDEYTYSLAPPIAKSNARTAQ